MVRSFAWNSAQRINQNDHEFRLWNRFQRVSNSISNNWKNETYNFPWPWHAQLLILSTLLNNDTKGQNLVFQDSFLKDSTITFLGYL